MAPYQIAYLQASHVESFEHLLTTTQFLGEMTPLVGPMCVLYHVLYAQRVVFLMIDQ
jgi:hypothetical protein